MSDNQISRLNRIASEILPGQKIETTARGEGYYSFEITNAQGKRSSLPPVWLEGGASDQQIKDKLSREFEMAFHPESSPGDLSVPNLKTETQPRR